MKVYVENGKYICDADTKIEVEAKTLDEAIEKVAKEHGLKKSDFASDGIIATNE